MSFQATWWAIMGTVIAVQPLVGDGDGRAIAALGIAALAALWLIEFRFVWRR